MPHDEEEPRSRYSGPFVCIRPVDGFSWSVGIEPILPTGEGEPRTYGSKHEAWGQMLSHARAHRLPVRDFTVSETARAHGEK